MPEIASRKHIEKVNQVVQAALDEAHMTLDEITAVAVTYGPGLVGALLIERAAARLSATRRRSRWCRFIISRCIRKLYRAPGSGTAVCLRDICCPADIHASCDREDYGEFEIIGRTMDDAAEAFLDKVTRAVGLGYPGGPKVDKAAKEILMPWNFREQKSRRIPV